jgi:hypothetical protein
MFETELQALQATFDAILQLPATIASAIIAVVYLILYPFICIFGLAYAWIRELIGSYIAIITTVQASVQSVTDLFLGVFDGVLPSVWVGLMLVTVALNVGLRLYKILKGVSIFGWSL